MNRKLKTLGAISIAILGMSASSASSHAAEFHSEATTTYYAGAAVGQAVFSFGFGALKCMKTSFTGSSSSQTLEELTLSPVYVECAQGMSVTFNGCDYLFNSNGKVKLACPEGKDLVFDVPGLGCTVTVAAGQESSTDYTNEGSGATRDIVISPTMTFSYTKVAGLCSSGNVTITGPVTLKGFSNPALTIQVGIFLT